MLPNHAPLMVAERFKVLEALFPGRIDLGLGRAPGTDPVTSYALRRRQDAGDDDFLERFQELLLFENNAFPEGHPFRSVRAMPQDVALPPIWLLGSSGYSAQLAAMVGAGFSFAHHFADHDAVAAMLSYRDSFTPFWPAPRFAPTARPRRNGSPPPSISTSCDAAAANTCRWRARRKPPLILIRRRSGD
jgi:luciferase family oxidoreductase group 1